MKSRAKRRINSTGRLRIRHQSIKVSMAEVVSGQPLQVRASIDLETYRFPTSASVILEAYYRSSNMRIDCGTVGSLRIPPIITLNELDNRGSVLFRLKVVDREYKQGKLLGSAESIRADEGEQLSKRSIFPVITRDLGDELWKVEVNEELGPKLIINASVPELRSALEEKENWRSKAFVLPVALRIVLGELVQIIRREFNGDQIDAIRKDCAWVADWLEFCREKLDSSLDLQAEQDSNDEDWIDVTVENFCRNHCFVQNVKCSDKKF